MPSVVKKSPRNMKSSASRMVIGIGNGWRGDDGIGPYLAERIAELRLENTQVIEARGETAELLELWKGAGKVIVIDAVFSGDEPGSLTRYDVMRDAIPRAVFSKDSTHDFGVVEAIELGKALNSLPRELILFGVEGRDFRAGQELSTNLKKRVPGIIDLIIKDLV